MFYSYSFISTALACYFENKSRVNRTQQNHQESSNITITQVYPLLLRSYLFLLPYVRLFFREISTSCDLIPLTSEIRFSFKIENKTIVSIKYKEFIHVYLKKKFL